MSNSFIRIRFIFRHIEHQLKYSSKDFTTLFGSTSNSVCLGTTNVKSLYCYPHASVIFFTINYYSKTHVKTTRPTIFVKHLYCYRLLPSLVCMIFFSSAKYLKHLCNAFKNEIIIILVDSSIEFL